MSNNDANKLIKTDIPWNQEHENILVEWADKAMCYRWLHSKSHLSYANANALFTIPVIIMSTVTGTANFAINRIPDDYQSIATVSIGCVNIIAAILSTIQQFLKITELSEAHRVSSISWDKFYRNIKVELAKEPVERISAGNMLKICKEEFDRLMETSPMIKEKIISQFKDTFFDANEAIEKVRDQFDNVKIPEICDQLISTQTSKHNWYAVKSSHTDSHEKVIDDFIALFKEENGRLPNNDQIIDNLKDKIDENEIKLILNNSRFNVEFNEDSV
jgi:hypothetical protein